MKKKILILVAVVVLMVLVSELIYFFFKNEVWIPEPLLALTTKNRTVKINTDVYLEPGNKKVGYFIPGQKFVLTGSKQDSYIQVIDSDGYKLWITEGSPYGVKK
ncbi:MAG: hypothetical protein Q7S03_03855 [bacterium]|nr:hypothetical protein [bacterium]